MASSIPSLKYQCVFGIGRHAKPNVLFTGNEDIIFPAGNSLVFQNIKDRKQKIFVPPPANFSSGISAIAFAPKLQYPKSAAAQARNLPPYIPRVAIGDNDTNSICVFDTIEFFTGQPNKKSRKQTESSLPTANSSQRGSLLTSEVTAEVKENNIPEPEADNQYGKSDTCAQIQLGDDFNSEGFVSLAFSGDGKYLLAQGKKPGWTLSIIKLSQEPYEVVASQKLKFHNPILSHRDTDDKKGKKDDKDAVPSNPGTARDSGISNSNRSTVTQTSFSICLRRRLIAATGNNCLKIFKLEKEILSELIVPEQNLGNIQCHLWITDNILLCADSNGDIFSVLPEEIAEPNRGVTQGSVLDPTKKKEGHRDTPYTTMVRYKCSQQRSLDSAALISVDNGSQSNQFSFLAASEGGYLTLFESVAPKKEAPPDDKDKKDPPAEPEVARSSLQFAAVAVIQLFTDLPIPVHSIAVTTDNFSIQSMIKSLQAESETLAIQNAIQNTKNQPENSTVIVTLQNNKVLAISLTTQNMILNNEEKPLLLPYHDGQILCCSSCIRKPIIATCGADKTVRVWNYIDNSLEIIKEYTEPVYCVSLHPDGLSMLIGFGDKLRFCSVFYDDIRFVKEFPIRGCRCCKFSTGGHLFAAVNGSKIQIYSSLTFQLINTLHRHSATVHDLLWGELDTVIASVGNDGAMFIHRLDNQSSDDASNSYSASQTTNFSVTAAPDFSSLYIVATDNSNKQKQQSKAVSTPSANKRGNKEDSPITVESITVDSTPINTNNHRLKEVQNGQAVRELYFSTAHKQIVMSNNGQMLFSGDTSGKIYSYQLPISNEKLIYNPHERQISSMALTFNDKYLFTAGDDGVLNVFNIIRDPNAKDSISYHGLFTFNTGKMIETDATGFPFYSEEVETTRADLEEKENQLKNLVQDKKELEGTFHIKKEQIENEHKQEDDKLAEEAKKAKDKNRILYQNKKKMKEDKETEVRDLEQKMRSEHENESAQKEDEYSKKIFEVHQVCENLMTEKENLEKQWKEKLDKERNEYQKTIDEIQSRHRKLLQEAQAKLKIVQDKKDNEMRVIEEMKKEISDELESSIHQTEEKIRQIAIDEEEQKQKLEKELGEKEGESKRLQNSYDQQNSDKEKLDDLKEVLKNQLNEMNKEIERLNEELNQKISTLNDNKKKFERIKEEREELEKHEKVLAYQRLMIQRQFGPLQKSITDEQTDINKMNDDLETAHRSSIEMNHKVETLQNALKAIIKREQAQTQKLVSAQSFFEQAKNDLHEVVRFFHASDILKSKFKAFYKTYVNAEEDKENAMIIEDAKQSDENVEMEHGRQKHVLQKQLHQLKKQSLSDNQFQYSEKARLLQQNASLIKELQMLRSVHKTELRKADTVEKRSRSQIQQHLQNPLLPATEAQRVIEENKKRIARLEEQLASYGCENDTQSPFLTEYTKK